MRGLRVLHLGCGDGGFGAWLLDQGATHYVGVDASAAMVKLSDGALGGRPARVEHGRIEDHRAEAGSFDLVVSRLSLHDVDALADLLLRCHCWLAPAGRLLITTVHPVITCHDARRSTDEPRTSWVVDDYFDSGPRPQRWMGGDVVFHHRTVEEYVTALLGAGFTLTALRECPPVAQAFAAQEAGEYARRRRIPLFLLLAGHR